MKIFLIAFLTASTLIGYVAANECDETRGLQFAAEGKFEAAYVHLKGCENHQDASAEVLATLAYLYGVEELGGLGTKKAYAIRFWELMEKAALTGHEDAIVTIASMYRQGDSFLGFPSEPEVADCLMSVVDSGTKNSDGVIDREDVYQCIVRGTWRKRIQCN